MSVSKISVNLVQRSQIKEVYYQSEFLPKIVIENKLCKIYVIFGDEEAIVRLTVKVAAV